MSRNGKGPQGGKGNLQRFFSEVKISNMSCMIRKLIDKPHQYFAHLGVGMSSSSGNIFARLERTDWSLDIPILRSHAMTENLSPAE